MEKPKDNRPPSSAKRLNLYIRDLFRSNLHKEDIALFYRQLAILMAEDVTLMEGLAIFNAGHKNRMSGVTRGIAERVEMGVSVRESLQKYPVVFNRVIIEILLNKENNAVASDILNYMADEIEKQGEIQKMISRTLLYPAFIFIFLILISMINFFLIIPVYEEIFSNLGTGLPSLTNGFVTFVHWITGNIIYIAIAMIIIYFILKTSSIIRASAKAVLSRLPVLGSICRRRTILAFSGILSLLLSSKIPFSDALRYSADAVEGRVLSGKIRKIVNRIHTRADLLKIIEQSAIFPSSCLQILYIGERKDSLDEAWRLMAAYFEKKVESSVFRLVIFLRSFTIIFLGLLVGFMVLSLYLPLFLTSGVQIFQ